MTGFLQFNPKLNGLTYKARGAGGRYTRFAAETKVLHQRVVEEMSRWAVEELDRHIRRSYRTGILEKAILDRKTSAATADGFAFLLAAQMDVKAVNTRSKTKPGDKRYYWRAIEYGLSEGFVGRIIPLEFVDPTGKTRVGEDYERAGAMVDHAGISSDFNTVSAHRGLPHGAFVGGEDRARYSRHRNVTVTIRTARGLKSFQARRRPTIQVKHPIQPYHYAEFAVARFEADGFAYYKSLLAEQAQQLNIVLQFTR